MNRMIWICGGVVECGGECGGGCVRLKRVGVRWGEAMMVSCGWVRRRRRASRGEIRKGKR